MTTEPEIQHRPDCGGDAGTTTTIGHSTTVYRCNRCRAVATVRHYAGIPQGGGGQPYTPQEDQ